ncbi:hypothetical protein [Streptomyces narbonensis]|uniref:hypothetical protein n=1 Tax=Streptomyces narbonensis TaxID=67333 RepID=UPI0033F5B98E
MKIDIIRSGAILATAALTVLASAACGSGKPTGKPPEAVHHSELVGRWDGAPKCRKPLPVVRLRDDYGFSVKNFPIEWAGPGPDDDKVTRLTVDGKWHAVNKDPGLTPYLVLRFENRNDHRSLAFYVENGELRMSVSVPVDGEPGVSYSCSYKRTSADPDFGR